MKTGNKIKRAKHPPTKKSKSNMDSTTKYLLHKIIHMGQVVSSSALRLWVTPATNEIYNKKNYSGLPVIAKVSVLQDEPSSLVAFQIICPLEEPALHGGLVLWGGCRFVGSSVAHSCDYFSGIHCWTVVTATPYCASDVSDNWRNNTTTMVATSV